MKSNQDVHQADRHVERLVNSDSYRRADRDAEFLNLEDVRGARLQLDYLKAELKLREQGIEQTIVVFGGTRILEPVVAGRRVDELQRAFERDPHDTALRKRLDTARRVLAKSRFYDIAREFGAIVGRSGQGPSDSRVTLMTGGGPGIMEAANRGAFDVGGKSIGLNIDLPEEQYPNQYISNDLCFNFRYFAIRKLHFLLRAKALVVFPGGFGTLDELFGTVNLIQTGKMEPLPVVLVGEEFWKQVFDADFLVREGVIDPEDRHLFWYAETAESIWDGIRRWHRAAGSALLCDNQAGGT